MKKHLSIFLAVGSVLAAVSLVAYADGGGHFGDEKEVVMLGISFYNEMCQASNSPEPGNPNEIPAISMCGVPGIVPSTVSIELEPVPTTNPPGGFGAAEYHGRISTVRIADNGEKFIANIDVNKVILSGVRYYYFTARIEDDHKHSASLSFSADRVEDIRPTTLKGNPAGDDKVWAVPVLYISQPFIIPSPGPTTSPHPIPSGSPQPLPSLSPVPFPSASPIVSPSPRPRF